MTSHVYSLPFPSGGTWFPNAQSFSTIYCQMWLSLEWEMGFPTLAWSLFLEIPPK